MVRMLHLRAFTAAASLHVALSLSDDVMTLRNGFLPSAAASGSMSRFLSR
jgi:hypothetical protein